MFNAVNIDAMLLEKNALDAIDSIAAEAFFQVDWTRLDQYRLR